MQQTEAAFVARLQAACPCGLQPHGSTQLKFTGPGGNVNSLTRRGTKSRAGQSSSWILATKYFHMLVAASLPSTRLIGTTLGLWARTKTSFRLAYRTFT